MHNVISQRMSAIHQATFSHAYQRYIGTLSEELPAKLGMNSSTHVAQVCLDPNKPDTSERAVVKYFRYSDKGWANEFIAWSFAQELGVTTAPRAALLIGQPSEVSKDHGPELNAAIKLSAEPMVLWCTSAVDPTLPLQQVLGHSWEQAALRVDSGKLMGALDGWTANCDRIANNALYWVAKGALVAIDHEKMAFNQDWSNQQISHDDESLDAGGKPLLTTRLIDVLTKAKKSKDKALKKSAAKAADFMFEHSRSKHPPALAKCKASITAMIDGNFSQQATQHLLTFLDYRITEECLKKRYGMLV